MAKLGVEVGIWARPFPSELLLRLAGTCINPDSGCLCLAFVLVI